MMQKLNIFIKMRMQSLRIMNARKILLLRADLREQESTVYTVENTSKIWLKVLIRQIALIETKLRPDRAFPPNLDRIFLPKPAQH